MYWEYVASGTNYTRLANPGTRELPRSLACTRRMLNLVNTKHSQQRFSLMFNAFNEPNFGQIFRTMFAEQIHSIYSDSGGLQMITRGIDPTQKIKTAVYQSQGESSDFAMSFDEIPIQVVGSKSNKLDMRTRRFDPSTFADAAIQTGRNLADQLAHFVKQKSTAKSLLIAHGNDLATFQQWVELCLREVPRELMEKIGGISMGGAALGNGMLEDIKRAFYFTQLPINCSHLHLLGVGSVLRLLPYMVFATNGVYPKDLRISYDSSTHTGSSETGRYYLDRKNLPFGKHLNAAYRVVYEDLCSLFGGTIDFTIEEMHDVLTCGGYVNAINKYGSAKEAVEVYIAVFLGTVYNFMEHVAHTLQSENDILSELSGVKRTAMASLFKVHSLSDYEHWESQVGQYIPSNAVRVVSPSLF